MNTHDVCIFVMGGGITTSVFALWTIAQSGILRKKVAPKCTWCDVKLKAALDGRGPVCAPCLKAVAHDGPAAPEDW